MGKTNTIPFLYKQGLTIKFFIIQLAGTLVPLIVAALVYYTRPPFGTLMLGLVVLCTIIGIPVYLRQKITIPLCEICDIAEKMAGGNLEETMPENTWEEISKISININAFSVNHQEILLHFWNRSKDNITTLETIMSDIKQIRNNDPCGLDNRLVKLLNEIKQTHVITNSFIYFDVITDDGKALTVNDAYSRRTI